MVAAVDLAGDDRGQIAPDQAEHRMVDEQRIDPGHEAAFGGTEIAYSGTWELPLNKAKYGLWSLAKRVAS